MTRFCFALIFFISEIENVFSVIGDPYDKSAGLTVREKQLFIDLHNAYRLKVALGQQSRQPPAANMIAMEWDDTVMNGAQRWGDTCRGWHNSNDDRKFNPFPYVGQDYTGNYGVAKSVEVWYDEVKDYSYNSNYCSSVCGHYTQVVWWKSVLIGCGYNGCSGRGQYSATYCDYAPGGNTSPNNKLDHPYISGKACTKCPEGFEYCMSGGLCASKRACSNSDSKCECTISSCENGGQFDGNSCSCKCKDGFEGSRCETPCADKIDYCNSYLNQCAWNANMWMWMSDVCRNSCKKCGSNVINNHQPRNSAGIKTNAFTVEEALKGSTGGTTPTEKPITGACVNKYDDQSCNSWAGRGECAANPSWMKENCAKACGSCSGSGTGNCSNKHNSKDCDYWANRGECQKNPTWMKNNCAASCKAC